MIRYVTNHNCTPHLGGLEKTGYSTFEITVLSGHEKTPKLWGTKGVAGCNQHCWCQNVWPWWPSSWSGPRDTGQGWGLLSQFPPFRYFHIVSGSWKHTVAIEYHIHIWQVSPQLSCGDTYQIWMLFKASNRYFCKIEYFAYGEINERSFSNPHRWWPVSTQTSINLNLTFPLTLNECNHVVNLLVTKLENRHSKNVCIYKYSQCYN